MPVLEPIALPIAVRQFSVPSPVGHWLVETTDAGLVAIDWIGDVPMAREPETKLELQVQCMLSRYFQGERPDFERLPLVFPQAGPGSKNLVARVMRELLTIPYGTVYDYQWLAERLGIPKGPRAVGQALGRNPIPIIVPCHRIVARNNRIGGFMRNHPDGGPIKRFLLELEGHRFTDRGVLLKAD